MQLIYDFKRLLKCSCYEREYVSYLYLRLNIRNSFIAIRDRSTACKPSLIIA